MLLHSNSILIHISCSASIQNHIASRTIRLRKATAKKVWDIVFKFLV